MHILYSMKKLIFPIIMMVVAAVLTTVAAATDGKPKIEFEEVVYNFGNIQESKGKAVHNFEFTNSGTGNLVIVDATAQCGCTRPEFPKQPIAPGKKGVIKVTYNPLGRPGSFDKTVTVKTNGSPSKVRLKIRGTVVPKQ